MNQELYDQSARIFSIAQAGLTYSQNEYDLERYNELKDIAMKLMSEAANLSIEKLNKVFQYETGYLTPKVDVRGVVFKDDKILLVKEKADGKWSAPGGWADWGFSPSEMVIREVREEAGLNVRTVKLLGIADKRKHDHPPDVTHIYKIFILCELLDGNFEIGTETSAADFFTFDALPPLSTGRITEKQIQMLFEFHHGKRTEPFFD
jgi:ADP-ribose pyrophosphatase YjhB (NUDIX family)